MAIQTTRWSPDTCGCKVEYTWDDTVPQEQRIHTFSKLVNTCSDHNSLTDKACYDILNDENLRKNNTLGLIRKNHPSLTQTYTNPDGTTYIDFAPGKEPLWQFSGTGDTRVLEITSTNLTLSEKTNLNATCTTQFGSGKVVIKK